MATPADFSLIDAQRIYDASLEGQALATGSVTEVRAAFACGAFRFICCLIADVPPAEAAANLRVVAELVALLASPIAFTRFVMLACRCPVPPPGGGGGGGGDDENDDPPLPSTFRAIAPANLSVTISTEDTSLETVLAAVDFDEYATSFIADVVPHGVGLSKEALADLYWAVGTLGHAAASSDAVGADDAASLAYQIALGDVIGVSDAFASVALTAPAAPIEYASALAVWLSTHPVYSTEVLTLLSPLTPPGASSLCTITAGDVTAAGGGSGLCGTTASVILGAALAAATALLLLLDADNPDHLPWIWAARYATVVITAINEACAGTPDVPFSFLVSRAVRGALIIRAHISNTANADPEALPTTGGTLWASIDAALARIVNELVADSPAASTCFVVVT